MKRLIILFLSVLSVKSAKILGVFPMPSISHQVVFRKLTQELAKNGHDLTIITTDPAYPQGGAPDNYTEIDIHDVSYKTLERFQSNYKVDQTSSTSDMKQMFSILTYLFEIQIQSENVQEFIANSSNSFDLIIAEALFRPAMAFSHIFKAPLIVVSSLGPVSYNNDAVGASSHPFLFPMFARRRIYNLNIKEKLTELYTFLYEQYIANSCKDIETRTIRKIFGPEIPTIEELTNNVDMLFLNIHPIWADNQPVPPNVIYMGGIHQQPNKEIPKDLKKYLDSSKKGVIYLSFGTNVLPEMIPQDKLNILVKVLSGVPYEVLWKWNNDVLPGKGDNIKLSKWYPQPDLLKHPNVKLFITQAGLQSTDEAITAGVPLLGIPMLGDQWYNAEKYVKHGIGLHLDLPTLNEHELGAAINQIITTDSYRQNVVKLRDYMNDSPETPLDRAIWWTEYVIRHKGAKHLKSPAANMSNIDYFEVKIVILILSFITIITIVTVAVLIKVYRFLSNFNGKMKQKLS